MVTKIKKNVSDTLKIPTAKMPELRKENPMKKKICIVLNEEQMSQLRAIREHAKTLTGITTSTSEILRSLLVKESQRINSTA